MTSSVLPMEITIKIFDEAEQKTKIKMMQSMPWIKHFSKQVFKVCSSGSCENHSLKNSDFCWIHETHKSTRSKTKYFQEYEMLGDAKNENLLVFFGNFTRVKVYIDVDLFYYSIVGKISEICKPI